MNESEFASLVAAIQRNCDIADARHAREATLCTYLLEMREFYRWQRGIPFGESLPRAAVGAWINAREAQWESLQEAEFVLLPLAGATWDPFAVEEINGLLAPHGLVYGAGIGRFGRPHFFLARRVRCERDDGLTILVAGDEYARDLSALPAALQRETVIVRQQALAQWLWGKIEAWQMKRQPGAMARALAVYDFAADREQAFARMLEAETESVILHERGEHSAARLLGIAWEERLVCSSCRRAEALMRAVRDHLADCLVTLPTLLEREAWPSLWFWQANCDGMRRALSPRFAAAVFESGAKQELLALVGEGAAHFERLARRLLASREEEIEAMALAPQEIAFA